MGEDESVRQGVLVSTAYWAPRSRAEVTRSGSQATSGSLGGGASTADKTWSGWQVGKACKLASLAWGQPARHLGP